MGLENGIVLATHHKINMDDIPEYIVIEEDDWRNNDDDYNDGYYYDVCYWRKCWNIRKFILSLDNIEFGKREGEYELDINHLTALQKKEIEYLCDMSKWEDSIWYPEDMLCSLAQDIANLGWLKDYIMSHKFTKIIFYDSY